MRDCTWLRMHSPVSNDRKHSPTQTALPRSDNQPLFTMWVLSVTAAMTLVSFPVIEVAVLGLAVLGLAVPGVERPTDWGLLDG